MERNITEILEGKSMKRFAAMMLAALLAASSTTVAFAAKNYDYIEFGGWVTLDYDAMDGGNVLVPGNTYTFPILDGSSSFNEESADIWSITASEYVPLDDEMPRYRMELIFETLQAVLWNWSEQINQGVWLEYFGKFS